jgi:small subunit ribosomal protein S9
MRPVCQGHVGLLDHVAKHFFQLSIACRYVQRVQRRPTKRFASTGAYDNQTPTTLDAILDDAEVMGQHARAVPVSPSYFSRQATFQDLYLRLVALSHKYASMPTVPADQRQRVAWRNRFDYRLTIGDTVKASDFKKCLAMVKKLHAIHPSLRTEEIDLAIEAFKRTVQPGDNLAKPRAVDEHGRAVGVGRRKSSTARAWLVEGTGEVQINGKSIADAFGRIHDRESATWALRATERLDKYNVWAIVSGGGTTGQAEAMTLAVAKALMVHEPDLKPALRRGMCSQTQSATMLCGRLTSLCCSWLYHT